MTVVQEIIERWKKDIILVEEVLHPSRIEQALLLDKTTVAEARLIIAALEETERGWDRQQLCDISRVLGCSPAQALARVKEAQADLVEVNAAFEKEE